MNNYYKEVDWLPTPPLELLEDLETVKQTYKNGWYLPKSIYATYGVDTTLLNDTSKLKKLQEFYQPHFDYKIVCRYQIITGELPMHIDRKLENDTKYNFLLLNGGEKVVTQFWSKNDGDVGGTRLDETGRDLKFEITIPVKQWHELNVSEPHSVTGILSDRFALVIRRDFDA